VERRARSEERAAGNDRDLRFAEAQLHRLRDDMLGTGERKAGRGMWSVERNGEEEHEQEQENEQARGERGAPK